MKQIAKLLMFAGWTLFLIGVVLMLAGCGRSSDPVTPKHMELANQDCIGHGGVAWMVYRERSDNLYIQCNKSIFINRKATP